MRSLIALSLLLASCAPAPQNDVDSDAAVTEQWIAAFYADYLSADTTFAEVLDQYYAEDVDFLDPTFDIDVEGHEALLQAFGDAGTPESNYRDIEWALDHVFIKGNDVSVIGRWAGRWHNCPFDVDFSTLFTIEDGKISKQVDFFGVTQFDRQVGTDKGRGVPTCEGTTAPAA